jgi:hypothetical protein
MPSTSLIKLILEVADTTPPTAFKKPVRVPNTRLVTVVVPVIVVELELITVLLELILVELELITVVDPEIVVVALLVMFVVVEYIFVTDPPVKTVALGKQFASDGPQGSTISNPGSSVCPGVNGDVRAAAKAESGAENTNEDKSIAAEIFFDNLIKEIFVLSDNIYLYLYYISILNKFFVNIYISVDKLC